MPRNAFLFASLAAILLALPLVSEAKDNGFGIYGGISSIDLVQTSYETSFSGAAIGADYRFMLGDTFSVHPFLFSLAGDGDDIVVFDTTFQTSLALAMVGVQFRIWFGDVFAGVHAASYSAEFTLTAADSGAAISDREADTGSGAMVGWEGDGGLNFFLQADAVTIGATDISSVVAGVGWRFK